MLNPVNKQIVVTVKKREAISAGGLHLPESSTTEDVIEGVVVSSAADSTIVSSRGDVILFPKHTARPVRIMTDRGFVDFMIVPSEQVLSIVTKN